MRRSAEAASSLAVTMRQCYECGEGAAVLMARFGLSKTHAYRLLRLAGTPMRSNSDYRRYRCDHSFFRSIDSEEKAYWLGFLAADGYIDESQYVVALHLADRDRNHLGLLKEALSSDHVIRTKIRGRDQRSFACLEIHSPELVADLVRLGIGQAKTLTVPWPSLEPSLVRHFCRGYMDGDGGIYLYPRDRTYAIFSVCGNESFLLGMRAYLGEAIGFRPTRLVRLDSATPMYKLVYGGRTQVGILFDFLYRDAHVFLERKRAIPAALYESEAWVVDRRDRDRGKADSFWLNDEEWFYLDAIAQHFDLSSRGAAIRLSLRRFGS